MAQTRAAGRWLVYILMTVSLAAAVFLKGGKPAGQWEWSALGISIAAVLALLPSPKSEERTPVEPIGFGIMVLLAGWMLLQIAPLPPAMLHWIAPIRWQAIEAARKATGEPLGTWAALSAAPAASFAKLLDVFPAMAALVAAREMAWWWRDRISIVLAPVVVVAGIESVIGLFQFTLGRESGAAAGASGALVTGTYGYHNHFSGLLEMALPIAAAWAAWVWRKGTSRIRQPMAPALKTAALMGVATCLLLGIVVSLSRMGFVSTVVAALVTSFAVLLTPRESAAARSGERRWLWGVAVVLVTFALLIFLTPKELVARFGELSNEDTVSQNDRVKMWVDAVRLISTSSWTGVGVGAFEHGLYRFKVSMPLNTIDYAHNDYLQFLAELGIIGTALMAAMTFWILTKVTRTALWRRSSPNWEFSVGILAVFLTLALHSIVDFNFYLPANALVMAWIAGVAVSPGLSGVGTRIGHREATGLPVRRRRSGSGTSRAPGAG